MTLFKSKISNFHENFFSVVPVKIFFSLSSYFRLQLRTETGWQRNILKNLTRSGQHQKAPQRGPWPRRSLKRLPAPRPRGSARARPRRPRPRSWRRPPTASTAPRTPSPLAGTELWPLIGQSLEHWPLIGREQDLWSVIEIMIKHTVRQRSNNGSDVYL